MTADDNNKDIIIDDDDQVLRPQTDDIDVPADDQETLPVEDLSEHKRDLRALIQV